MPPLPKDPTARRRRNKVPGARVLERRPNVTPVPLPPLTDGWHPATVAWWEDAWRDPMAAAWLPSDVHRLLMLAVMVNDYWNAPSSTGRKEVLGEIRLTGALFGLSPIDRRRLNWTIEDPEPGEDPAPPAKRATKKAPAKKAAARSSTKRPTDPRLVLVS